MRSTRSLILAILGLALAGCGSAPDRAPAIGEAFAGPATMVLRQDLHPRSPAVATLKHGERLDVLQRRRRFFRVRTAQNVEGWTDARQLLSTSEMERLRALAERSAGLPSQGRATVFDALNIHTEPNRQSPSFDQIPEHGWVDVIGCRLAPRTAYNSPILSLGAPEAAAPRRKPAKKKDERLPLLPMPRPPAPPPNWLDLSRSPETEKERAPAAPAPSVPSEDWSLVRTKDGKAGWVLTRMLTMAIPDEVAQYAEGHRITSYFSLGDVRDGETTKQNWLWTTLSQTQQPYQFDSYRIFIWSLRHHRFETAAIERNLEGYYPVTVQTLEVSEGRQKVKAPGFSLIVREKDGKLARRTYAFVGQRARLLERTPWTPPPEAEDKAAAAAPRLPKPGAAQAGFLTRAKERLAGWRQRWFGR